MLKQERLTPFQSLIFNLDKQFYYDNVGKFVILYINRFINYLKILIL